MKVLNYPADLQAERDIDHKKIPDLTLCTRCRHPWGFELVEKVEMWSCDHCGYEAREKSVDFFRMQLAEQEQKIS